MPHLEDDQSEAVHAEVRYGHASALILARPPVGNLHPRTPSAHDVPAPIELAPDAIEPAIRA